MISEYDPALSSLREERNEEREESEKGKREERKRKRDRTSTPISLSPCLLFLYLSPYLSLSLSLTGTMPRGVGDVIKLRCKPVTCIGSAAAIRVAMIPPQSPPNRR